MTFKDYLTEIFTFTDEEKYYKSIFENMPDVYSNFAYQRFGHQFIANINPVFSLIDEQYELSNRMFVFPLSELSFSGLGVSDSANVVFSKHSRYVPSRIHCHTYFEIICQCKGESKLTVCGDEITLSENRICIIPPCVYHSVIAPSDDSLAINLGIKNSFIGEESAKLPACGLTNFISECAFKKGKNLFYLVDCREDEYIGNQFTDMLYLQKNQDESDFSTELITLAVRKILRYLVTYYGDSSPCKVQNNDCDTLVKIIAYMRDNYKTATLASVSKELHFSLPYVSRMIKINTGNTFSELISEIRMNVSLPLLSKTELSVSDISAFVGYKAPENYMRNFKSSFGITPTEFRTKIKVKKNL